MGRAGARWLRERQGVLGRWLGRGGGGSGAWREAVLGQRGREKGSIATMRQRGMPWARGGGGVGTLPAAGRTGDESHERQANQHDAVGGEARSL